MRAPSELASMVMTAFSAEVSETMYDVSLSEVIFCASDISTFRDSASAAGAANMPVLKISIGPSMGEMIALLLLPTPMEASCASVGSSIVTQYPTSSLTRSASVSTAANTGTASITAAMSTEAAMTRILRELLPAAVSLDIFKHPCPKYIKGIGEG